VRNLRKVKMVYCANVSESSGASSLGLFLMKGHSAVVLLCCDIFSTQNVSNGNYKLPFVCKAMKCGR